MINTVRELVDPYYSAVDWLAEYPEKVALASIGYIFTVSILGSMSIRYAWRTTQAEPESRAMYAIISTLADTGSLVFVIAAFIIVHAGIRWRTCR